MMQLMEEKQQHQAAVAEYKQVMVCSIIIINPWLLRVRLYSEGYCSRFVCVCVSVATF